LCGCQLLTLSPEHLGLTLEFDRSQDANPLDATRNLHPACLRLLAPTEDPTIEIGEQHGEAPLFS
jgi:hypothetical protein